MIIGIDPALRETGIASIDGGNIRLWTFKHPRPCTVEEYPAAVYAWALERELVATILAIEWPPIEVHGRTKEARLLGFCSGVWSNSIPATRRMLILEPSAWYRRLWGHTKGTKTLSWAEARQICESVGHPGPADEHQAEALCIAMSATREGSDHDTTED